MSKELPGPWGPLLSGKGVHSYQDLANELGVSKATAHRLVTGGQTSSDTVGRFADKYVGGDRTKVWAMRGERVRDYGPWSPASASLLDPEERDALSALINLMVRNRKQVMGDGVEPPSIEAAIGSADPESEPADATDAAVRKVRRKGRGGAGKRQDPPA